MTETEEKERLGESKVARAVKMHCRTHDMTTAPGVMVQHRRRWEKKGVRCEIARLLEADD